MGTIVEDYIQRAKSGLLYFRRAYPVELRPFIPGSRTQLRKSLGATSITAPGVMDRFREAEAEYGRVTAMARKAATGTFDRLAPQTIPYLVKLFERDMHQADENSLKIGRAEQALNGWNWLTDEFREWRREQDFEAAEEQWGRAAMGLLEAEGLLLDPQDKEAFGALCMALNDAAIGMSSAAKARLSGDVVPLPPEPLRPVHAGPVAAKGLSFSNIVERIMSSPLHNISETTKETTRTALRYFKEAFGDLPPEQITLLMVTEWLNLLALKPRNLTPTDRKFKLRELVERYEGQEARRLSPKTLEQYVTAMSARWRQAAGDGFISKSIPNPFGDRKIKQAPRPENKTQFTRAELQAIFSLPIFTQRERPAGGKGEASFWMPLLLLFTGARPEEIAQLMVGDVFQDPGSGRWVLRITDEGEHPHKGRRQLKTSSTSSGRRTFPLHPELLRLNFLTYVEHVRGSAETALFPRLRPKGRRRYLHAQWASWWGKHLRAENVLPPVGDDQRKPVREFRDVWATAARASKLPRETMEYIMGHRPPGATSNEDYGQKGPLGEQIDAFRIDGLDLSSVRPWGP